MLLLPADSSAASWTQPGYWSGNGLHGISSCPEWMQGQDAVLSLLTQTVAEICVLSGSRRAEQHTGLECSPTHPMSQGGVRVEGPVCSCVSVLHERCPCAQVCLPLPPGTQFSSCSAQMVWEGLRELCSLFLSGQTQRCWLQFTLCTIHRPRTPLGHSLSLSDSPQRGTRLCYLQSSGAEVAPQVGRGVTVGEKWAQVGSLPNFQVETRRHHGRSLHTENLEIKRSTDGAGGTKK